MPLNRNNIKVAQPLDEVYSRVNWLRGGQLLYYSHPLRFYVS